MEGQRYTEHDWKLFRAKIADWQEGYMERLNREYIELLSGDGNASDKFWELEKRIREDKRKAGVIVDMRRSVLIDNILRLLAEGAIELSDLDEFSDGVKDTARFFLEYNREDTPETSDL